MRSFFLSLLLCTPIMAQQMNPNQIRGTAVVQSPAGSQTITQPANTSLNILTSGTGGVGVSNINGVLNASLFAGADLGAKVQNAITGLNGSCGKVIIPAGTYTWTTPSVIIGPCQRLDGNGAFVNVSTGTSPFLIMAALGSVSNPNLYTQGGIDDITFSGPGPSTGITTSSGIYYGGDSTGVITPNTWVAFLSTFHNLHIRNFGCGFRVGVGFQFHFYGGSIENNYAGMCFDPSGGGENISFHGTQIINNIQYGIYSPNSGPELNLYGVSLDYNGQNMNGNGAQILMAPPDALNIFGGHMENKFTPFIEIVNGPAQAGTLNLSDLRITVAIPAAGAYRAFIEVAGPNPTVHIDGISVNNVSLVAAFPGSLIDFTGTGGRSQVFVKHFFNTFQATNRLLPVFNSSNTLPDEYEYPALAAGSGENIGTITNSLNPAALQVTNSITPGKGFQSLRNAGGCATAAAVGATCTTALMSWTVAPSDLLYTPVCTLSSPTGVPTISSITTTTTGFTVTIAALTAAAAGGNLNCIEIHD